MTEPGPFDPNDYRKRVLAAVLARGGPEASDPFELYDLPVADDLDDAAVATRVADVWGAWQRQRDHPKYRVLVALLVERHTERSAELLDAGRRRTAAARVRAEREQRDAARFELLDAAVSRLVARHGGVPRDKVAGLEEVGALAGLTPAEVATRLRRHRVVDAPTTAEPAIGPERRRQIRALLDEFGRLTDAPPPPTLLHLLGTDAGAGEPELRARAAAWRSRARELPPARLRSVVDELLVHVAELLEPGRAAVDAYLDAVAVDVGEHLRPRVRAAVLVEDRLVADDHAHLLDEAIALGLDRDRAAALLAAIAAELGAPVETVGSAPAPPVRPAVRAWEEPLRAARAALRAGRPREAQRHVQDAQGRVGPDGATPVRAVADEVAAVLADADRRRRAAAAALDARRFVEAVEHLEHLARTAADVPGPDGLDPSSQLERARREVAHADAAVAAALAGAAADRPAALAAVLDACPGHPGAAAALAAIPVPPPAWVRAARDGRGDVLVVWEAPAAGTFKVSRLAPDGRWQVVGRVTDTSVLDGGAPPAVEPPVYAVETIVAGRSSAPTRSDEQTPPAGSPPAPSAGAAPTGAASTGAASTGAAPTASTGAPSASGAPAVDAPAVEAPTAVRAERDPSGTVVVAWDGPAGVEYRVRCRRPDGGWRVVGRTRATRIEDGGAGAGPLPEYAVSAARDGARSAETST